MKKIKNIFTALTFCTAAALCCTLVSCYSVFYGGASGNVVDGSTTSLTGISGVDVYGYISKSDRDKDVSAWTSSSETTFTPTAKYYGHTKTGTDGSFSISKMYWKAWFPNFGKDADYTTLYLLYFHEDYGVNTGDAIIMSEVTTDSIYNEIYPLKKSVTLTINVKDVATDSNTSEAVRVKVSVPQNGYMQNNRTGTATVYGETSEIWITGTGTVTVSFPKYTDSTKSEVYEPEITLQYFQQATGDADGDGYIDVSWIACETSGDEAYAFKGSAAVDAESSLAEESEVTVKLTKDFTSTATVNLYGKAAKFTTTFSGTVGDDTDAANDGKNVVVTAADGKHSGSATTAAVANSTGSQAQSHGHFSGLSLTWYDYTYTGQYASSTVSVTVDGTAAGTKDISSQSSSYGLTL